MNFLDTNNLLNRGFRLTKQQMNFLAEGSYGFITNSGKSYYRDLKVVAQEKTTGKVLVKESYIGDYSYEKKFILSPEGRSEKFKNFRHSNPIEKVRAKFPNLNPST